MAFWESSSVGMMRDRFAAQFTTDGDKSLYRENGNGPALLVTELERQAFFADYERYLSKIRWTIYAWLIPPMLITFGSLIWLDRFGGTLSYAVIGAAIIPSLIAVTISGRRATTAPTQALIGRQPVAPALSSDEATRVSMRRIPWQVIAALPILAAYTAYKYHVADNPLSSEHIFWTLLSGSMVLAAGVQGFRKWRAERSTSAPDGD